MPTRRPTVRALLAATLTLVAIAGGTRAIAAGGAAPVGVSIVGRAYLPADLTVGLGQTVTWRNETLDKHTVTSVNGLFNSGVMTTGSSFAVTFTKAGTFDYKCTIHPTMHGSVLVLAIPAGTVVVRLTRRHVSGGEALVVHVQAARADAAMLLQASRTGGGWHTLARSHLSSAGQATLTLAGPAHGRLRVVVPAAAGAPRLVSPTVRAPA
jgi:plastocyanin